MISVFSVKNRINLSLIAFIEIILIMWFADDWMKRPFLLIIIRVNDVSINVFLIYFKLIFDNIYV